jgi:hypothetical protein
MPNAFWLKLKVQLWMINMVTQSTRLQLAMLPERNSMTWQNTVVALTVVQRKAASVLHVYTVPTIFHLSTLRAAIHLVPIHHRNAIKMNSLGAAVAIRSLSALTFRVLGLLNDSRLFGSWRHPLEAALWDLLYVLESIKLTDSDSADTTPSIERLDPEAVETLRDTLKRLRKRIAQERTEFWSWKEADGFICEIEAGKTTLLMMAKPQAEDVYERLCNKPFIC